MNLDSYYITKRPALISFYIIIISSLYHLILCSVYTRLLMGNNKGLPLHSQDIFFERMFIASDTCHGSLWEVSFRLKEF